MVRHLFELRSRTAIIGIRINRNTATWSKDARNFDIFGIHQFYQIFHDDIHTVFMECTMTAEAEQIKFQTLAFHHLNVGDVADTYFCKVRLSGYGAQACKFGTVETYPVIIFRSPNTARKMPVKNAMKNSFGFGGTNSTIIYGLVD